MMHETLVYSGGGGRHSKGGNVTIRKVEIFCWGAVQGLRDC